MGGPSFRDFQVDHERSTTSTYTPATSFGPADQSADASIGPWPARAPASAVGNARLRRPGGGHAAPQRHHHAAAGAVAAEQPVHAAIGRGLAPIACSRRPATKSTDKSSASIGWPSGARPTDQERESARRLPAEFGLAEFCLVIFNSNEFLYVD